MVTLVHEPIDLALLEDAVRDPACGGVVTFIGRVRNHHEGRTVVGLEYEAYEPMALRRMQTIVEAVGQRWELGPVAVCHRLGRLEIGEAAVVVMVASAHREAAFAACREIIDQLKADVPIWKREAFADGTTAWVAPGGAPIPTGEEPDA